MWVWMSYLTLKPHSTKSPRAMVVTVESVKCHPSGDYIGRTPQYDRRASHIWPSGRRECLNRLAIVTLALSRMYFTASHLFFRRQFWSLVFFEGRYVENLSCCKPIRLHVSNIPQIKRAFYARKLSCVSSANTLQRLAFIFWRESSRAGRHDFVKLRACSGESPVLEMTGGNFDSFIESHSLTVFKPV